MRNGKGKNQNHNKNESGTHMSKLRASMVLNFLDELGERSGCHRMPERSFFYKGWQFPVCARCTGVCLGQFTAIAVNIFCRIPVKISLFLLAVMGVDWGVQELKIKPSTNIRRFITGMFGGFGLFSIYITVIKWILKDRKSVV